MNIENLDLQQQMLRRLWCCEALLVNRKRAIIHCNSPYENIGEMNKQLKFVESSYNPEAV